MRSGGLIADGHSGSSPKAGPLLTSRELPLQVNGWPAERCDMMLIRHGEVEIGRTLDSWAPEPASVTLKQRHVFPCLSIHSKSLLISSRVGMEANQGKKNHHRDRRPILPIGLSLSTPSQAVLCLSIAQVLKLIAEQEAQANQKDQH